MAEEERTPVEDDPAVKVDAAIIKELLGKEATASELERL